MKKIITLALVMSAFALLISACSATKSVVNGGATRSAYVGTWTLTDVGYQNLVEGAVQTIFDQGPPASFIGSTWSFTNSGNGSYTLSSGTSQKIFWSLNGDTFQFKKIFEGDKAKNVAEGYQLAIVSNDGSNMKIKAPVGIGSTGTGYVVYTFAKSK
ncbi:hypothetical protein [Mucilaginibacter polytrichastri]|uniref:Lipocalin-like domain-containing protein n=1 Tax=Mucilaginibacter polytrichastri TaxID=1302689 RepID=A0A1Q6A318_9SPHI|nr:hypothetical protein [Mucilaginibacter polytrichastri]OKS88414.1 hypothetical protein RG47T_3881 [Mucilaginibacter polytrichastri]SFT14381.1 hypothetical protein SAMN04487890_112143 [Mucilaginibacter polytrichastri]